MPATRISGASHVEHLETCDVRNDAVEPTRTSGSGTSLPAELEGLFYKVQKRRATAASLIVKRDFTGARDTLAAIAPHDPDEWRTYACQAFDAWRTRAVDHSALHELKKVDAKQFEFLRRVHTIVEQSLKANVFTEPLVLGGARPAIVVPGKQLSAEDAMDRDLLARMETALKFAKRYPNAPIILSGGATVTKTTECSVMATWLEEKGIARERLLLDPLATVTTANALQTIALLRSSRHDTNHLLLVTDDDHIRRANVIFGITLLRSGLGMTMTAIPAGGTKAGKLAVPADENERTKVYLDAMHACELFAFRGRPRFYQREHIIGDEIPGDAKAGVEVALPKISDSGPADGTPQLIDILRLDRGELPRGAESLLLERLLRAYNKVPQGFKLERAATADLQKAVIDTIERLGLEYSHTRQAAEHIEIHIKPAATAFDETGTDEPSETPASRQTAPRSLPREPVVDARHAQPADQCDPATSNTPVPGLLVINEPRFLVSPDGNTYLNGATHAMDLDSVAKHPAASFDEVRIRVGVDNWNETDLMKLGSEAARLLRDNGRLILSTGAQPDPPLAMIVEALMAHGFSTKKISAPVETPFYPDISDPSAGGVTLECTKHRA